MHDTTGGGNRHDHLLGGYRFSGIEWNCDLVLKVNAGTANGTIIADTVTATSSNQAFGASAATFRDGCCRFREAARQMSR